MYKLDANGYCGLLMPKHVMEKAAKLIHKHQLAMRELFKENKEELEISHWSMSSCPDPVYIDFILGKDKEFDVVESRIKLFKVPEIKAVDELYIVKDYNEAKEIAENLKNSSKERDNI